ncbi:helix-turn-helix domain-containing protein [Microtetraspora fusca]|uniref:Helix-turn-helix domain-containing protein n=1 Tax=Microtetraspora fusca TaxID=1997 RepID=A0ABW6UWY6_MICFU
MRSVMSCNDGPGGRIAAVRTARRITQDDLAWGGQHLPSMIRKLERGSRNPSDNMLDAIAVALGVDWSRLLSDAGRFWSCRSRWFLGRPTQLQVCLA